MSTRHLFLLPFALFLLSVLILDLQAADGIWNTQAGNWNAAGSWLGGTIPGATAGTTNPDQATFGNVVLGADRAVTVDANRNLKFIEFNDTNSSAFRYTLSGGSLVLTDGGSIAATGAAGAHVDTITTGSTIAGDSATYTFANHSSLATRGLAITGRVTGSSTTGNTTTVELAGANPNTANLVQVFYDGVNGGQLGIVKNGSGTWTIGVSGGSYQLFSGPVQVNAGTLRVVNANSRGTGLGRGSAVTLADAAGATIDLTGAGDAAVIGSLAGGGATGGVILTSAAGSLYTGIANTNTTFAGTIGGTGQFRKYGDGTQTLANNHSYTGATQVLGGTLALDFSAATAAASDIVPASSALTLGGGTLHLLGKPSAATSQTVASTAIATGASALSLNLGSATSLALDLKAISRSNGGTLDATLPSGTQDASNGIRTSTTNQANNVLVSAASNGVAYATVGGATWASVSGGNLVPFTGSYFTGVANYTTTRNIDVTDSDSVSGVTVNTLRFDGDHTLTLAGTNTVNTGGILVTANAGNGATITGGTLRAGGGTELVLHNYGAQLTIDANIANSASGASRLTISGSGTTVLGGDNTYTGITYINSGTVKLNSTTALGTNSTVVLGDRADAVLDLNGQTVTIGGLSGGGTRSTGAVFAGSGTAGGLVDLGASGSLAVGGGNLNGTYGGMISGGPGSSLVKIGTGTQTINGDNPGFAGTVWIKEGLLQVATPVVVGSEVLMQPLGTGTILLGDTAPNPNNATLNGATASISGDPRWLNSNFPNLANPIILGSGTTGTLLLRGTVNNGIVYSGGVTGVNDLTVDPASGANLQVRTNPINNTGNLTVQTTGAGGATITGGIGPNVHNLITHIGNTNGTVTISGAAVNNTGTISNLVGFAGRNVSISAPITATSGIVQDSLASLTLTGNSSFTAPIQILAGTLIAGGAAGVTSLGSNSAVSLANVADALLDLRNAQTLGSLSGGGAIGGNVTLGNTVVMTLGGDNTDASFFGTISGGNAATGLAKTGTGVQLLGGINTYAGPTTINGGTLQFAQRTALYNATPASWTATSLVVDNGATAAFNVGGAGEFTAADLDILKGFGTATGGFRNGASLGLDTSNAPGEVFTYTSAIDNPNGGANALGLVKLGAGTLALTANHGYTGPTLVEEGTLLALGSISGAVTVQAGATLGGDGAIGGRVAVEGGGTLAPGSSPAVLTVGELDFQAGSTFAVELFGTIPGSGHDQIWVTGDAVGIADGTGLELVLGFPAKRNDTFLIVRNDGADSDFGGVFSFAGVPLNEGDSFSLGVYVFGISYAYNDGIGGNDVLLTVLIPEPTSLALLALASLAALRRPRCQA